MLANYVRLDRVGLVDLFDDASVGKLGEPTPQLRTVAAEDRNCGGGIVDVVKTERADARDQGEQLAAVARVHSTTAQPKLHMRREHLSL